MIVIMGPSSQSVRVGSVIAVVLVYFSSSAVLEYVVFDAGHVAVDWAVVHRYRHQGNKYQTAMAWYHN